MERRKKQDKKGDMSERTCMELSKKSSLLKRWKRLRREMDVWKNQGRKEERKKDRETNKRKEERDGKKIGFISSV